MTIYTRWGDEIEITSASLEKPTSKNGLKYDTVIVGYTTESGREDSDYFFTLRADNGINEITDKVKTVTNDPDVLELLR